MKKFIMVIMFAILGSVMFAQENADSTDKRPLNNIYMNFIGDASNLSINYERVFFIKPFFFLTAKFGIGFTKELAFNFFGGPDPITKRFLTLPHHITGNLGKGKHFFEFGLGGTVIIGNNYEHYLNYLLIGYRIQPINIRKVNFRIFGIFHSKGGGSSEPIEDIWFVPFGFSIGISF